MSLPSELLPVGLLGTGAAAAAGYSIERSVRFNSADSAYLSRTPASAGNRKTWTWAGWVKRSALDNPNFDTFFNCRVDGSNYTSLFSWRNKDNDIGIFHVSGGSTQIRVVTDQVFRDTAAWFHLVCAVDTTAGTASDRVKLYINGTLVTALSSTTYGSQNIDTQINTTNTHHIGKWDIYYTNGYLADIHFLDGITPGTATDDANGSVTGIPNAEYLTSFGEFDADTGIWNPIAYTGSYGTNGFHLPFSDNSSAAALGDDTSGNNNDWTVNNIVVLDYGPYASQPGITTPSSGSIVNMYDGTLSTNALYGATTVRIFAGPSVTASSSLEIAWSTGSSPSVSVNSGTGIPTPNGGGVGAYYTVPGFTGDISTIDVTFGQPANVFGIRVDGQILLDASLGAGNDSLIDVPQNGTETDTGLGAEVRGNYCTWNPLHTDTSNNFNPTLSNGNLDCSWRITDWNVALGTLRQSSGKWYWEITLTLGSRCMIGITKYTTFNSSNAFYYSSDAYAYFSSTGDKRNGGASGTSYGATFAQGDVIGVALDLDAGTLVFYKNGVSQGTAFTGLSGNFTPLWASDTTGNTGSANFGQRRFAYDISIGISDATGAIPILSTSDDYGQTLSSGTATDSSASSLELALPGGTSAGLNLTDQSPSGRTSSTKTVVNNSVTNSTAVTKFYGGAAEFTRSSTSNLRISGTGLTYPVNSSDSCTIEFWLYMKTSSYSTRQFVVGKSNWGNNTSNYSDGIRIEKNASNNWTFQLGTATLSSSTTLNTAAQGSWAHVAAVRNGSTLSVYINGQLEGTATASSSVSAVSGDLIIGNQGTSEGSGGLYSAFLDGYITDLRYYIGVAKYTANFTPPSSALYKALCTANLPAPTVENGSTAMDVALYTGNGSTQTISGLGFSPDLVWIKRRDTAQDNNLYDSVRGSSGGYIKQLLSNTTSAESPYGDGVYGGVTALNSDGFSLDSSNSDYRLTNASSSPYVAWTWDAGSSTVSNTDGSITSSVRANPTAGFSIVKFNTGTSSPFTVGHGLGVKPALIIDKATGNVGTWSVYHSALGATKFLRLNTTDAANTQTYPWNNTEPTSTVFTGGDLGWWGSNFDHIAYCFAPVEGYSSFGSYTGNGIADGPFVFTGFRPRWVLIKRTDVGGTANYDWSLYDSSRDPYNLSDAKLTPNSSVEEGKDSDNANTDKFLDILSSGFKIRAANAGVNASGGTFVYACFAENPFALNARAR